jgi:hypothetical protein
MKRTLVCSSISPPPSGREAYMCPQIAIYVSSYYYVGVLILLVKQVYPDSPQASRDLYCYICVLILIRICPHTTICVSSYYH